MNASDNNDASQKVESTRGFWALIATQFQGAFSDNVLKWLAVFLVTGIGLAPEKRDQLVSLVSALFALPFIVFSMAGGFLADRFSKRTVTMGVKVFEIFVMLLATAGLVTSQLWLTIGCVFLMGVHSAFFAPSKYGLLPELLPEKKLSWGNGVIELGTFMAIISGTVAGGVLSAQFKGREMWLGIMLLVLAGLGLLISSRITKVPAADPAKVFRPNFLGELWRQIKIIRQDRILWLATLGNTWFFALGALLQLLIVIYTTDVMHLSDASKAGYLNAAAALGIGLGSVAAGYLSGGKIEYGLVPLGSAGMTLFCALLGRTGLSYTHAAIDISLLGFFGGFFIVPLSAILQHRPERANKGGVLAASSLLSFVGIFLSSGVFYVLTSVLKLSPTHIFLILAVATFAATVYVMVLLPDSLLRFFLWCVTHTFYRIRVEGRNHVPAQGGALFVCNHVSWMDALLLISSTDRPVRCLMFKDIYDQPLVKPFAKMLGVIPISSEQRPRELIQSLHNASAAIKNGEVVCIFAEGQITRLGQMMPFHRGMERIMKEVDAPVIPVALDGLSGSPSSFKQGRFVWWFPARIPHPVTVSFGAPLPAHTTAFEARQAVQELMATSWQYRRDRMKTLPRTFVKTARRHPSRFAMGDAQTPEVSFGSALVKTVFLAQRLKKTWLGQPMVGLLLPPSVPGALVNWAALLSGKVPVNLNYTLSDASLASCARQCGLKTVLTSRAFLEKVKIKVPGEVVYLEDLAANPRAGEKLRAWLQARLMPVGWLEKTLRTDPPASGGNPLDALATVIFSSGSTGEPKGVMLSHYNIGSNIEQMEQVFDLNARDRFLGVLPFFHSFGFTGTLALTGTLGVGVVFHPNPLDARSIGHLVQHHAVTFLLATPTFLQLYLRGCQPEQFGSVRLVAVSAEKLPARVATAFEERFGIRPLEAYGCTECSPAVTVNTFDFRAPGVCQIGSKRGKIGHPLPGVCVRVTDVNNPFSGVSLPLGEAGMLLVRGPNVMQGYLGQPAKTAEVLHDGWYVTGDVATLDEDGFVQITDRLSRFSKIGGEMVPHMKVEEKLHELAGTTEQTFVVSAVPDEKKGERLVVLHKLTPELLQPVLEKLAASDLPNLWKPRAESFFHVDAFPQLGTGKLDLRAVKELAKTQDAAANTKPAS